MKINKVTYSALANIGNYENEKIELEGLLEDGDTYESCLEQLRNQVHEQLRNKEKYNDYCNRFYEQRRKLDEITEKLHQAYDQWEETSAFLIAQGLKPNVPSFPIERQNLITAGTEEVEPEIYDDDESEF